MRLGEILTRQEMRRARIVDKEIAHELAIIEYDMRYKAEYYFGWILAKVALENDERFTRLLKSVQGLV